VQEAPRRVGRAILIALLISLGAELIPLVAMLTGAKDLPGLLAQRRVFMSFIEAAGGHGVAQILGLAIGLAIINAVIAMMLLSARQIYATGRDGAWGRSVDRVLAAVHPKLGSPWAATLVSGVVAGAFCFIPLKLLLIATGTSVSIVYAALCVGLIAGRRTGSTRHTQFRVFGFPVTPVVALIALAGVLWSDWIDPVEGRPGLIASFAVAVVAAIYYLAALKQRGWTPLDPAS
jgi:amino acid transporter